MFSIMFLSIIIIIIIVQLLSLFAFYGTIELFSSGVGRVETKDTFAIHHVSDAGFCECYKRLQRQLHF